MNIMAKDKGGRRVPQKICNSLGCWATGSSLAVSLTSLVACVLLYWKTSGLLSRVSALEERGSCTWELSDIALSLQDGTLHSILQPQIDQILKEKLGETLRKVRPARDVSMDCACPPGPPGRRGKPGRRGNPGSAVSTRCLAVSKISPLIFPVSCMEF
ncbi:collagen alpha-1(XXIII) chain-like [Discoglossus pictus]